MPNNTKPSEGVIRYQLDFTHAKAEPAQQSAELRAWFQICHQTQLLGQSPERYEGVAYGNLSVRLNANNFLITGTQTSGLKALSADNFAVVSHFSPEQNQLIAHGPCEPSSEAMTHGMIYRTLNQVNAVFHAHSAVIWNNSQKLGLPTTHPDAEYGTPEMTQETKKLLSHSNRLKSGVFSMGGHEDGIVAYGANPEQAGCLLLATLAAALRLTK